MRRRKPSKLILEGEKVLIEAAVRPNGSILAVDYYDGLSTKEKPKFWVLFQRMAQEGLIFNREKFKKVEDDIYEFKVDQHRIFCFWAKNRKLILTHGFYKQSQKAPRDHITKAKTIRKEYVLAQQNRGD